MDVNEEHVQTLLSMGFPHESEIRTALRLGKNDLNEAVAILTNEHPGSGFETFDDVEMKDEPRALVEYGPSLPPPSYDDVVHTESCDKTSSENSGEQVESQTFEFPVTNLYELEGRVFTESWSIPYKKEESLGKCLMAAIRLAKEGLLEADEYCRRFLNKCMPECFHKLMFSGAVYRWNSDIHEGIYTMVQLLVDLVVTQLQHDPVPVDLLYTLAEVLNPDSEFHTKNRLSKPDRLYWEDKLGQGKTFGQGTSNGWLTNFINRFAYKDGFSHVERHLRAENLDLDEMAALLVPFGVCAEFLNPSQLRPVLGPGMERVVKYITDMTDNELKDKKVACVSEILASVKLLCKHLWQNQVSDVDNLRLQVALRMLKSPNFNARMNALKDVTKLIEDSTASKPVKIAIPSDKLLDWLVDNKVLSVALEGNIDQSQYCDKVKGIVDFLGARLSEEELTKIWHMQDGETSSVIDNIYSIIAVAVIKFNSEQLEHFFLLVQKSWKDENDRLREKLLVLIGRIGKDARNSKITTRVLELLWDLAHLPALKLTLVELALDEHLSILSDSYSVKEQTKKGYVIKCVEDIKKGVWVLPALKQLLHITKNIAKHSYVKAEKGILHELNKGHEIIKLVTNSLVKCHKMSVQAAAGQPVTPSTVVDGKYRHEEVISNHLTILHFILQEGVLYLHWHRARDIWDTLVASSDACDWDKEACFDWFTKGISDLEPDTQSSLFQKELLRHDASKITPKGFQCWKCFFENVNLFEHRLKRSGTSFSVEKLELIGLEYLWEICLNTSDEEIASSAIRLLMSMSYTSLNPKLKKDPITLHKKFIKECYSRLEAAMITFNGGGSLIYQTLSCANRTIIAPCVAEALNVPKPLRSDKLLNIERILKIAEKYVLTVEEMHTTPRTILPHGASFMGNPVTMTCVCETPKMEFQIMGHMNESLASVRRKIADHCKTTPDNVQIYANEKLLGQDQKKTKDHKLLHQLGFADCQHLNIRVFGTVLTNISQSSDTVFKTHEPTTPTKSSYDLEQEKMLPGVVMAMEGQVFGMLYQLSELDEPKITTRVRQLLMLIPTDPSVSDNLDSIGLKLLRYPSPDGASPMPSPKASPRKVSFTPSPMPSPRMLPKEVLKNHFDANAPEMSTFRVLYNLEVLSSKLMPIVLDPAALQSAMLFCEEFLNTGGLGLVINVLQKDSIPLEVEYSTRQDCYAICLQLARFLLCGETVTGEDHHQLLVKQRVGTAPLATTGGASSSAQASPSAGSSSLSAVTSNGNKLGPLTIDTSRPSAASRAIQHMGVNDFTETVACLMRVTWAAAAGRLHLASSIQPIKDANVYSGGRRSRQSSTGSSTSTNSESESQCLHAGVCVQQTDVSSKDTLIAKEALELLVTCLQIRCQLIASFYSLPCVSDFIIDVLVGCTQSSIRCEAVSQFSRLMTTDIPPLSDSSTHQPTPHQFLVQVLMKARLPFWISSANTRGSSQRLLSQCGEYFELRCRLLENLSRHQQGVLQLNPMEMLEDEIAWLQNYVTSEHPEVREADNLLLEGHLNLIGVLLTCEGVDKTEIGKHIIKDLLYDFLFPASKMLLDDFEEKRRSKTSIMDFNPKCSDNRSRTAAYRVLVELADQCLENLDEISTELITMHHKAEREGDKDWEYMPPVDSRSSSGFVGLKNGGATCYMNSVIQQLFMTPTIPDYILSIDSDDVEENSVFYQMQQVFANLMESKLQYYQPDIFWRVFKLWGQTVNIREQQDAFDFFQALVDQVDERLKEMGRDQVFKKKLQGIFSDQKICNGCPHRYEREEAFFALNLTVKNATLQDSLDQFVKGELLDGDNAYFCEKCGEKRDTMKRMCIKTLPSLLCIQLKRFSYDWEANRALKFDDYFKFPWVLDMEPFTTSGIQRQEAEENADSQEADEVFTTASATCHMNYELVGVVVHSGQANAGHYYSFIKDRRGTTLSNPSKNKWFKFNDTVVEEFDMNDTSIEAECFGGTYKAKVYEHSSSYPEERVRYWNGYLLFYERVEDNRSPVLTKKSRISLKKKPSPAQSPSTNPERDSLSELTELVHKGERKHLFTDKMPARIQQTVRQINLSFMKNRDVYDVEYFRFVHSLAAKNVARTDHERYSDLCLQCLKLSIPFLYNTYYRTKGKLREDSEKWVELVSTALSNCKEACQWMIRYMTTDLGRHLIRPYLLECPNKEVREAFGRILQKLMAAFFQHGGITTHKLFNELLESILDMLKRDVPDNCKNSMQYFTVLSTYVHMGTKAVTHMFLHNAFPRLVEFLLGSSANGSDTQESSRRWSSVQSREFAPLHNTLALLILNCNVSQHHSEDPQNYAIRYPECTSPQIYLRMSQEMAAIVFHGRSSSYVKEVIHAIREIGSHLDAVEDMLVYCSFCNSNFSMTVLKQIMLQYSNAPCNELKGIFAVLTNLLLLKDPLQMKRLQCVIDGYVDESGTNYEGMLSVIKACHQTDSRRSYQCIKLLVSLSSQCALVKDYLLQTPTKWQWAVNWLKKKMTEYYAPQANSSSNEDSSTNTKLFQRTISAQDTLAEATAILDELETQENSVSKMDTNGSGDHAGVDGDTGEHSMSVDKGKDVVVNTQDEVDQL